MESGWRVDGDCKQWQTTGANPQTLGLGFCTEEVSQTATVHGKKLAFRIESGRPCAQFDVYETRPAIDSAVEKVRAPLLLQAPFQPIAHRIGFGLAHWGPKTKGSCTRRRSPK